MLVCYGHNGWQVCASVTTDKRVDEIVAYGACGTSVVPQERQTFVIMEGPMERPYDTEIWQRWSLDATGYQEFIQIVKARPDTVKRTGVAGKRLADRLETSYQTDTPQW